jgi:hypothetical protein
VGSVVVAADQAGSTNYLAATEVTRTITVNQGIPVVTLAATPNPVLLRNTVTLTATVSSLSGTPTGMVMFSDGAISLGSATVVGGVASVAASALPVGADAITAAYSGDSNFLAAGSPAFNEAVEDFSLSFSGGAAQTVQYGGTATYSLAIAPIGGSSIPLAVSLAVSGVPPGSMVALTPVTLPAGSGGVNVNLSIQVPSLPARAGVGLQGRGRTLAAFALLGVVLPFRRRMRLRGSRVGWVGGFVLLLAGVSAAAGISGCGREVNPATEGFIVTVSATAGGLTHSASTPLVVQ